MPDEQGAPPKGGGNKLTKFIKRNKALSAVIGVVGVYVLFKETKKGAASESEGEAEGEGQLPSALPREANDETHEALDEEIHRVEQEAQEGDRENQEDVERIEDENRGEPNPHNEPAEPSEPPTPTGEGGGQSEYGGVSAGLTIHGKLFAGATNSHISGSGQTDGGKKYIEYTITFPGRQEHWWYFTASGNWKQVKNSATGPGANKPPTGSGGGGGGSPTGDGGQSGGGSSAPPQHNANHPDAVNTGNRCVNGGIGGHSAPAGYHLFCEGGWIWRAPNKIGIAPNQPVAPPAPPAPPASPPSGGGGGGGGGGGIDGHPNAVKTENRCVNGGVGKHTAPAGYHLFCASDGWIWRAPNGG